MKTLVIKWLGLAALAEKVKTLETQNAYLSETLDNIEAKVNEIEIPDMDDYMTECDLESYLHDNDYITQSYCDDEIESKVSEAVESAIEDADIEEKVRDLFNDASPAPMSEEEIKKEVAEAVKVTLEKMVKALADQAE